MSVRRFDVYYTFYVEHLTRKRSILTTGEYWVKYSFFFKTFSRFFFCRLHVNPKNGSCLFMNMALKQIFRVLFKGAWWKFVTFVSIELCVRADMIVFYWFFCFVFIKTKQKKYCYEWMCKTESNPRILDIYLTRQNLILHSTLFVCILRCWVN